MRRRVLQRPAGDDERQPVATFERHAARRARHFDARHAAQTLDAGPHETLDRIRLDELRARHRHAHRQHVRGIEAGINRAQRERGADEQRRSDEQDERQRDFDDNEDRSRLVLPEAGPRSAGALLERRREIGARGVERGDQAEDDAGGERDANRERQYAHVHRHERAVAADARQSGRVDRQERADARDAENHSEHAAGEREDDALGQELTHDASPARANRSANRDFAAAPGRSHQQQVRHVRARDQQHEPDRAREHEQRRPHVADEHVLDALHAERLVLTDGVRKSRAEFVGRGLEPRVRLLDRDARLQARRGPEIVSLIGRVPIELERDPDLRRRPAPPVFDVEGRAEDADHGIRLVAERDRASHDGRIAAEPPRPQAVAEHGNGAAPRTILLLRKRAPPKDGRTEQPEELGADASAAKLLDAVAAGVIEHVVVERRGLLDDARLLAPMRELRGGRGGAGSLRRRVHEEHHAIRLGRRQRLQQHRVQDREDGRVRADPERQRRDGGERERRRLDERADGVAQVGEQRCHGTLDVRLRRRVVMPDLRNLGQSGRRRSRLSDPACRRDRTRADA